MKIFIDVVGYDADYPASAPSSDVIGKIGNSPVLCAPVLCVVSGRQSQAREVRMDTRQRFMV